MFQLCTTTSIKGILLRAFLTSFEARAACVRTRKRQFGTVLVRLSSPTLNGRLHLLLKLIY